MTQCSEINNPQPSSPWPHVSLHSPTSNPSIPPQCGGHQTLLHMLGAPRNTVNSDILHHAEGCLMTDCECYIWHTQYHSDPIWMPWIPVTHLSDISGAPKNADKSFAAFSTDPKSPIKMFPHSVNKIKLYFTLAAYLQCLTGKKD